MEGAGPRIGQFDGYSFNPTRPRSVASIPGRIDHGGIGGLAVRAAPAIDPVSATDDAAARCIYAVSLAGEPHRRESFRRSTSTKRWMLPAFFGTTISERTRDMRKSFFARLFPLRRWWTRQATSDVAFDDEFMELAAASGCKALFLGLETISQASLNGANKRHNKVALYRDVIERFHH